MARRPDLTGQQFGRLTVIEFEGLRGMNRAWRCICECGTEATAITSRLTGGRTRSCGCLVSENNITHGLSKTPTYRSWKAMVHRVQDTGRHDSQYYAGRGITVCARWLEFESFLADMGERPEGMSIDRTDNDRGYEPGNCRWATKLEQMRNRSNTRTLEVDGRTKTIKEWAEATGISYFALYNRVKKWGFQSL